MVQDMTDPNIEPSLVRDQLLKIIEGFGFDSADRINNMREKVATEALLNILDRHLRQKYVDTRDAGELMGLNEALRDIGVWKTFDKALEARAAIKEQYAKLQEQREKDTVSTPDLLLEASKILGENSVQVTTRSGEFYVKMGEASRSDRSLREAVLLALKETAKTKLTMAQHKAVEALVEKAVG